MIGTIKPGLAGLAGLASPASGGRWATRCGLGTYEYLVFLFVLKSTIWIFFFADKLVFVFDIKPKMGESAFYIHLVYK